MCYWAEEERTASGHRFTTLSGKQSLKSVPRQVLSSEGCQGHWSGIFTAATNLTTPKIENSKGNLKLGGIYD